MGIIYGTGDEGLGARDNLRLEAGMMLYGQDMDISTNPFGAGLGWLVDFGKGEFPGKSALGKVEHQSVRLSLLAFKWL